jgi:hypothetical protein
MKKHFLEMWFFIASIISCNVVKKEVVQVRFQQDTTDYRSKIKITVPDFSDPEIYKYHKDFTVNFVELVKAVRQKDTIKAWAASEKDYQFYLNKIRINKAICLDPKRMQPADYQRETYFLSEIEPLYNEIKNTIYIQEEIRRMRESFSAHR